MEKRTTTPLTYVTSGAAITRRIFEDLSFQTVGGGSFRNLATLAEQCGDAINFHAVLELSSGGNRRIGIGSGGRCSRPLLRRRAARGRVGSREIDVVGEELHDSLGRELSRGNGARPAEIEVRTALCTLVDHLLGLQLTGDLRCGQWLDGGG
jgi:hypothetical protein